MKSLARLSVIAVVLSTLGVPPTDGQTRSQQPLAGSRFEAGTYFGAMIAGKEIERGVNATGRHEQLIARLNHGGALGLRFGVHSDVLGLEASFLNASNAVRVDNEFGVRFPNHGERPLIYSGDALLYPFRRAIREGKLRPYLTSGIGGMLMSADLDNIDDQETHNRLTWNAGGGMKVFMGEEQDFYLDFRFTNHRLPGSRGMSAIDLRSITVGVGYRF
jgi:opacity protein-like surface antigen